jgi:hypothetical protein
MEWLQGLAVATVVLVVLGPGLAAGQVADEGTSAPGVAASVSATEDENVTGQPGLALSVPDNEVDPGAETSLTVVVYNDGNVTDGSLANPGLEEQVTLARLLRVRIGEHHEAPVSVNTNERFVSRLPDGERVPVQFGLTVDGDAQPGEYRLPVNVTYNYTRAVDPGTGAANRSTANQTLNASLVVTETAQFDVVGVESAARVGATGTVNVTLVNSGFERARNASITLTSENSELTLGRAQSGGRYVGGAWEPGERRTIAYRVNVARSASQQRYAFDAQVSYENSEGNVRRSGRLALSVVPEPEQTFSLARTSDSVEVGDEGTLAVTLRNDGPLAVRDASVTVQSTSGALRFDDSTTASEFVGRWASGQNRTVEVNATASSDAELRNYTVRATVEYEDQEGDAGDSRPVAFGIRPEPEREYEFTPGEFDSALRVGEEGTLTGSITNTGDRVATNVVVVFETSSETLAPLQGEYPVGTLTPGESGTVAFDLDVGGAAESGPRQFTLRPRYRDADDERQDADSFDVRAEVRPERDVFAVDVGDAMVARGGSTTLAVTMRNDANETVTDVSGQLFADSPISVTDDEAFVGELAPGEETTIRFEIGAGQAALTKAYPVEIDFQYDDADGDTQLSDTYRVPVAVTEPEDDEGVPLPLVAGAAVVLVVVAGVVYRRYA